MVKDSKLNRFVNKRIFFLLVLKGSFFGILIYRLFNLQVTNHSKYKKLSEKNYSRTIIEPALRGVIFDKNGEVLAENQQEYLIILDLKKTNNLLDSIKKIAGFTDLNEKQEKKIYRALQEKRHFVEVKSISFDEFVLLKYQLDHFPELLISKNYIRTYPQKDIGAHIIGYVVNETKKYSTNHYMYNQTFKVGKTGLEAAFNANLSGQNGVAQIEVNSRGKKTREINSISGFDGKNLKTSLNLSLQRLIANEILDTPSSIVVINLEKNSLEAVVSNPSFNPEIFNNSELREQNWARLSTDPSRPLINKAVSGLFSPGSAFKVVVALAALESKVINSKTEVFCNHGHQVGNRFYKCMHYHGSVNVQQALQKSCNSFFYAISKKLDIDFLAEVARDLGFGKKSNLKLVEEMEGNVPSKFWKLKKFGKLWYPGDSANFSIGQGYLNCTPMQLAIMCASIASGKSFSNLSLLSNSDFLPTKPEDLIIKEEHLKLVRKSMFDVVNSPGGGTAYHAIGRNYPNLRVCGKTGTVQISSGQKHKNHSVFIGFAPFEKPKYALSIVGEFMGYGSSFAAPLAGKILNFLLKDDEINI
jgi:penicillin-binding protein 2